MYDYLVVGLGLSGVAFCETLEKHGKRFQVITDRSQQSSEVAAGLYNPVILKRFTLAWKADEQLALSIPFYGELQQKLGVKLDYPTTVLRRFASVEEQNLWFEAADKPTLRPFLSTKTVTHKNPHLHAPFGYGKVLKTGRIDTALLLKEYANYLDEKDRLVRATFNFRELEIRKNGVRYGALKARRLVFATGYGLKVNPYFSYLPLNGTKGELLTIRAPELKEACIIKSGVFCIPLGKDHYRVGSTYKWKDKTNLPTEEARAELLEKLDSFLKCPYEIVNHVAGIRPTVTDRRPLVGSHPRYADLYVLNGLGSRGVLLAPYAARQLFELAEYQQPVDAEMDIARFSSHLTIEPGAVQAE